MHDKLGHSLTEAGFIIALQSGASLIGQFFSGMLADKFGARKLMILGLISCFSSVGLIGLFPIWEVYAPSLILFGFSISFVFVPLNTLIHLVWPGGGRRGYNILYVCNNAGVAIGTALGGLLASYSFRFVFLINSFGFFLFFLLVILEIPKRLVHDGETSGDPLPASGPPEVAEDLHPAKSFSILMLISLGLLLVWSAYSQLTTILPVIMERRGFSTFQYSILWTLNGIYIVLFQPFIRRVIQRWAQTFRRQIFIACILLCSGFLVFLSTPPYYLYIIAILFITFGEMLILPAIPAAAARLAPSGKAGTYQGIVGGASAGGRMVGPLIGGMLYDRGGARATWFFALSLIALSFMAFSPWRKTDYDQI